MSTDGMDPATRLLKSLQALAAASAQGSDTKRIQEEAAAAIADWSDKAAQGDPAADITHILRGVTPEDRALLREGLRVITEWARRPGEEAGKRVDAVIERMQHELGPLMVRDREAEKAANQEALRASVRESIARRLREARLENPQNE